MPNVKVRLNGAPKQKRLSLARATARVRNETRGIQPRTNRLPTVKLEAALRQEPTIQRGIWKQTGDALKPWFRLVQPGTTEDHNLNDDLQAWCRAHRLRQHIRGRLIDAHLHGDGYLELEWAGGGLPNQEVTGDPELLDTHAVDPAGVDLELRDDGLIQLVQRSSTNTVILHPDRYEHFRIRELTGHLHGLSTVELAWHIVLSKIKGDQSLGEVLYHSGVPREAWIGKDADDDDIADLYKVILDPKFSRATVTDDKWAVTQLNPTTTNPSPFYDVFLESVAAAIGIPSMLIRGAQAGAVEGSETNLEDYHSDLHTFRQDTVEPFLERVVGGVYGLTPDDYDILWNPFPQRASVQADLVREQANAWTLLTGGRVDPLAAARIVGIELNEDDMLEPDPAMLPPTGAPGAEGEDELEAEQAAPMMVRRRRAGFQAASCDHGASLAAPCAACGDWALGASLGPGARLLAVVAARGGYHVVFTEAGRRHRVFERA